MVSVTSHQSQHEGTWTLLAGTRLQRSCSAPLSSSWLLSCLYSAQCVPSVRNPLGMDCAYWTTGRPALQPPPLKEHFLEKKEKHWQSVDKEMKGLRQWSRCCCCFYFGKCQLVWFLTFRWVLMAKAPRKVWAPRYHSQYADITHLFVLKTSTHTCFLTYTHIKHNLHNHSLARMAKKHSGIAQQFTDF